MKILDKSTTDSIMEMAKWDGRFIKPIDSITFDEKGAEKAMTFWKQYVKAEVPEDVIIGDILLSGLCPVYDMLFQTTTEKKIGDILYGRIMVFPDLVERVQDLTVGELYVGVLLLYTERIKIVVPFKVSGKSDYLILDDSFGVVGDDDESEFYRNNPEIIDEDMIRESTRFYMNLWYGTSWVILNPMTRIIVKRKTENDIDDEPFDDLDIEKPSLDTTSNIRYVRTKVITEEDFEKCSRKISHTIQKDCWYVSGHFRDQPTKSGKKRIYIKPFWKGPMRDLKNNSTRTRELVYNEQGGVNNE